MKKISYRDNLSSYFYVEQLDDFLIVISIGSDNPFEFTGVLFDAINELSEQISNSDIEIYFDLLSCVGNNENRLSKLSYNKNKPSSFINNIVNIHNHDLPFAVLNELKKFYSEHLNEALFYSILSKKEKCKLSPTSII